MKLTQLAAALLLASGSSAATAATYDVTPLPVEDKAKTSFAKSIDNTGTMLTAVRSEFNPRLDVALLNESGLIDALILEDADAARAGQFTSFDYQRIVNTLQSANNTASLVFPSLADFRTYVTDTVDATPINGLDAPVEGGGVTQTATVVGRDSLNRNFVVGASQLPFVRTNFTTEDGEEAYFLGTAGYEQAFAEVNGTAIRLPSPDDTLNGYAEAFAVNNNFQVAGYGTTGFSEASLEAIANCADEESRNTVTEAQCLQNVTYLRELDRNGNLARIRQPLRDGAQIRPVIWQLDAAGSLVDTQVYPLVFTPEGDQLNIQFIGQALDINNAGVAVGYSQTGEIVTLTRLGNSRRSSEREEVAVLLANGETTELLPRDENIQSRAISINDDNWIAGQVTREPNNSARDFLFVHNPDTGETFYPQSFFDNAQVRPTAINNNNIVVGNSQFERQADARQPRTHAIMYQVGDESVTDLNLLTSCDSEYLLLDAIDINDNNEIIANALVRRPKQFIDGELDLDAQGEQELEDRIVAVKLTPNPNGEIETCEADDVGNVEEEKFERSGASTGLGALAGLLLVAGWRRLLRRR